MKGELRGAVAGKEKGRLSEVEATFGCVKSSFTVKFESVKANQRLLSLQNLFMESKLVDVEGQCNIFLRTKLLCEMWQNDLGKSQCFV
jgi:hypothetical protein